MPAISVTLSTTKPTLTFNTETSTLNFTDAKTTAEIVATTFNAIQVGQVGPSGQQGNQGVQGVQGIQGIQGNPGVDGVDGIDGTNGAIAATYIHTQAVPSATWVIVHGRGGYPSVTVIDSGGSECEGAVTYDSTNQLTLVFSAAFAGTAYLN